MIFRSCWNSWRTCLHVEFDLPALSAKLNASQTGDIQASLVDHPDTQSFAQNVIFDQVSRYAWTLTTRQKTKHPAHYVQELIQQAVFDPTLRPKIDQQTIDEFVAKRQRRAAGYEPSNPAEWGEWLKERVLIPILELPNDPELPGRRHHPHRGSPPRMLLAVGTGAWPAQLQV